MFLALNPSIERDRLECAAQLYARFLDDALVDPAKARTRLIAGIQVALEAAHLHRLVPEPYPRKRPW